MRHQEDTLQQNCVRWFALAHPDLGPWLHHSPNGGRRNLREAARFKSMGVRAGFPDLFLPEPVGGFHGLFVELKSGKNTTTAEQRTWLCHLSGRNYRCAVVRSLEEFRATVDEYLNTINTTEK